MNLSRHLQIITLTTALGLGQAAASSDQGTAPDGKSVRDSIVAAVGDPGRPAEDRKRDPERRPAEVLEFLGIRPGMRVAELMPGHGYYSAILARVIGPEGRLYVQRTGLTDEARAALRGRLASAGGEHTEIVGGAPDRPEHPGELDAVLLIRGFHDFCYNGVDIREFLRRTYDSLKPGGILGVVDHRGAPGVECTVGFSLHRIDPWMVEYQALIAGFVLEEASDLLRNPDDDVAIRVHQEDPAHRDRTDRFLFRFRKPTDEWSEGWEDAGEAESVPVVPKGRPDVEGSRDGVRAPHGEDPVAKPPKEKDGPSDGGARSARDGSGGPSAE